MEKKKTFFATIRQKVEDFLPMSFGNFLLFLFMLYLIFIVCRVIINNYNSNKALQSEEQKVVSLTEDIKYLQYQINYYQTNSYKEKEAREKLGYKAPGEIVMQMPIDNMEDQISDSGIIPAQIKVPNYRLWLQYFFDKQSNSR